MLRPLSNSICSSLMKIEFIPQLKSCIVSSKSNMHFKTFLSFYWASLILFSLSKGVYARAVVLVKEGKCSTGLLASAHCFAPACTVTGHQPDETPIISVRKRGALNLCVGETKDDNANWRGKEVIEIKLATRT